MAKRRKPEKPPPISVDWRSYKPTEVRYWMFGGPYIEPDDIPPERRPGSDIGPGYKPKGRRKYAAETKASYESTLKSAVARYVGVKKHGMNGLSPYIRDGWQARVHSGSVEPDEADPVSASLACEYKSIAWYKGSILACDAAVDEIDRAQNPLLFGRD